MSGVVGRQHPTSRAITRSRWHEHVRWCQRGVVTPVPASPDNPQGPATGVEPDSGAPGGIGSSVVWQPGLVSRDQRAACSGGVGSTIWLTGLSGAGKSTIASEAEAQLVAQGRAAYVLDGDNLRHGLCADLGFDAAARNENVRRIGEVACLLADAGLVVLVALVSPYRAARDAARARHEAVGIGFAEVFVDTPLEICQGRDPKGLYAASAAGTLVGLTGVDDPYEPPLAPALRLDTSQGSPQELAERVVRLAP